MSTSDKLASAINAPSTVPVRKPQNPLVAKLMSPAFKKQLAIALPKTITADRMTRIVLTEVRKNPALLRTTPDSFMGAVMQASQLGIEVGSSLGQGYLVPFGKETQFILGYKGMIDLARRSGQVLTLNAYAVYEGDEFSYQLGLHPDIHHVPSADADRTKRPITFAYAVATLRGDAYQFEVMSRAEIEAIKAKAKSKNIWNSHFEEMAKKTVIRRLFKYLPVSIEAIQAANLDAKREAGEKIEPEDLIDINAEDLANIEDAEIIEEQKDVPPAPAVDADGVLI